MSKLSCLLIDASTHLNGFRVCVSKTHKELLDFITEGDGVGYEIISSSPFSAPSNVAVERVVWRDAPVIRKTSFTGGNDELPGGAVCVSRVFPLPLLPAQRTTLSMANLFHLTQGPGLCS